MARRTDRSLRAAIRQWRFPRALRIAPAEPPPRLDDLAGAVRALAEQTAPVISPNGSGAAPEPPPEPPLDDRAVADLATGLWRARRRMLAPGGDEPRPEVRKAFLPLRSAWDTLAGAGIEVQDHDGVRYVSGLALEVLAFQPTPGLEHEEVVETIRPSVYVRGRMIQVGQVVVGTPDAGGPEEGRDA